MPNLYVWDFHGVLERDNEYAVVETINDTLRHFSYHEAITLEEESSRFAGKHWRTIFLEMTGCAPEDAARMEDYALIIGKDNAAKHVKPREHAHDVLRTIRDARDSSIVISNSDEGSICFFLRQVGMANGYFDGVFFVESEDVGPDFDVVAHKHAQARGYIDANGPFGRIRTIGDRETDVELGLALDAETFLFVPESRPVPETKAYRVISDLRDFIR